MAENNGETTIVGADSHFKGELSFEKSARINGKFDGQISGKGELQISQNALCKADVQAVSLQIDGTIEGNVKANDTVRLNANGVIRGDISAEKMVMAEGASLFGQVSIGPDAKRNAGGQGGGGGASGGGGATTAPGGVSSSPGTPRPGGPSSGAAGGESSKK